MSMITLTQEEKNERARELAETLQNYDRIEKEKKDTMSDYTDTLKGLRSRAKGLAQTVRTGMEWREDQAELFGDENTVH